MEIGLAQTKGWSSVGKMISFVSDSSVIRELLMLVVAIVQKEAVGSCGVSLPLL